MTDKRGSVYRQAFMMHARDRYVQQYLVVHPVSEHLSHVPLMHPQPKSHSANRVPECGHLPCARWYSQALDLQCRIEPLRRGAEYAGPLSRGADARIVAVLRASRESS